jgi:hypothetical protein
MHDDWAAVDVGKDPTAWARLLRRAYVRTAQGAPPSTIVRPMVAESWRRCARAGVKIELSAPRVCDSRKARRTLRRHRIGPYVPLLEELLVKVATRTQQIAIIADFDGLVLWTSGHEATLVAAERIHLAPGARWDEAHAGTNAIGTGLALNRPVQIFSAEHYRAALHGWSSAAAPIRDPHADNVLGAVALAGPYRAAHPHAFSLVAAVASVIEGGIDRAVMRRREALIDEFLQCVMRGCQHRTALIDTDGTVLAATPAGWLGPRVAIGRDGLPVPPPEAPLHIDALTDGQGFVVSDDVDDASPPVLRVNALGADRVEAWLNGHRLSLSPRHSELLVVLALHPEGIDDEALARAVYGHPVNAVTVRAEICRLRKLLGSAVATRPYRLVAEVHADFLPAAQSLPMAMSAAPTAAPHRRRGSLLPASGAPAIVAARRRLTNGAP